MAFQGDSIYWVELEKVVPNPFQPRREFDQKKLEELSESIRMYGVLQPLTVTRNEVQRDDGTFYTEYELIAGERRLRASKLAGVAQVPVIIREGEQSEQEKLELAIIENLQREDLNAVDRALAFRQLADSFGLSHAQVAGKVGRSREYVSNSIRLLGLPDHILDALKRSDLMEGHARTLLMLTDKPEEQEVIFREIVLKKLSVREVERIVRKIAAHKVRKKNASDLDVNLIELERQFTETLGTRVQIQKTDFGGKLTIDYFSEDDLAVILKRMREEAINNAEQTEDVSLQISHSTGLDIETRAQDESPTPVREEVRSDDKYEATENSPNPIVENNREDIPQVQPEQDSQPVVEPDRAVSYGIPPIVPIPQPPVINTESVTEPQSVTETQAEPMLEQKPEEIYREKSLPDQPYVPSQSFPAEPANEEVLPSREEVKEAVNEFQNFIAHYPESQSPAEVDTAEDKPEPEEEAKPAKDVDESDLYSIRNFNV
jgi:ParB family chromosome partitioning protein